MRTKRTRIAAGILLGCVLGIIYASVMGRGGSGVGI